MPLPGSLGFSLALPGAAEELYKQRADLYSCLGVLVEGCPAPLATPMPSKARTTSLLGCSRCPCRVVVGFLGLPREPRESYTNKGSMYIARWVSWWKAGLAPPCSPDASQHACSISCWGVLQVSLTARHVFSWAYTRAPEEGDLGETLGNLGEPGGT